MQSLIIDDNAQNIKVLEQLLRIEGVQTTAITALSDLSMQFDSISDVEIVFLDLEMPTLNGYDVLAIIRAHPNFSNTKVIAYSVHINELDNTQAKGFDGFLGKPLSAEEFPNQLERILDGEQVWYIP